jgi:hypothetical protein
MANLKCDYCDSTEDVKIVFDESEGMNMAMCINCRRDFGHEKFRLKKRKRTAKSNDRMDMEEFFRRLPPHAVHYEDEDEYDED